ncbi:hypothetical protein GCM10009809_30440 [Isoptericola hypogeus]|uniref:Cell division protein FtsL n=1 Tax=Isoptericola hypogeus TaxID=300179 RepID=A0ABN2JQ61_9MICO
MSALRAPATTPGTRTGAARGRTSLTALEGGATRGRLDVVRAPLQATSGVPFLVLCAVVLAGALLAALLLNITMARGSYESAHLQREVGHAAQDVEDLQAELRSNEASLADLAKQLGMVPADEVTMISIETRSRAGVGGDKDAEGTAEAP